MPTRIYKWTQNAKMVKAHGEAHIPPGAFCGLEPAGLSGGGDPRGGGACTEGPRPPTVLFAGAFQTTVFPTVDCMEAGVREGGGVRNKAFGAGILECGARRGVPAAGELMPPGQWRYRSHEECQAARHSLHACAPHTRRSRARNATHVTQPLTGDWGCQEGKKKKGKDNKQKTMVRCHEVGGNALTVCVLSGPRASSILVKGSANLLSFHTTRQRPRASAI